MAFNHGQCSAARWTGISSDSRRSRFLAPAVLLQGLAERQMLGLGLRRKPRRVGRKKREWGVLVLPILGKVEMHAPN